MTPADMAKAQWVQPDGRCPRCDKPLLKDNILLTRVVALGREHSTAKCTQCKALVRIPVVLTPR
jgi:RNase P subunit RPR2